MQIKIFGKASQTTRVLEVEETELDSDLLTILRKRSIPVASSCSGEGICKKCVIQKEWLTCKLTLRDFLASEPSAIIEISYL